MKKNDIVLTVVLLAVVAFIFRTQITGFFLGPGMGNFQETGDEICMEDGKPIVYFFASETCPHCTWEKPIIESVAAEFEDYISFHENIDNNEDRDIMSKYSSGGVPFIVIGCKFARNGSGENIGEYDERQVLRNLICQVTDSPIC
jgi:thiol-disulfide isomerase/thioredoxin